MFGIGTIVVAAVGTATLSGCWLVGEEPTYTEAVDQDNRAVGITGGLGTPVVQSFIADQSTSVGADIRAHGTSSLTGDYEIGLYTDWDGVSGVSGLIASGEVANVAPDTDAQVRWEPVAVTPGQTYYLYVEMTGGALTVGSGSVDEYPDGDTLEGGGNLANVEDIYFITYYAVY